MSKILDKSLNSLKVLEDWVIKEAGIQFQIWTAI